MTGDTGSRCVCIVHHWSTEGERQQIVKGVEYAQSVGDMHGFMVALCQLTEPCPAREPQIEGGQQ